MFCVGTQMQHNATPCSTTHLAARVGSGLQFGIEVVEGTAGCHQLRHHCSLRVFVSQDLPYAPLERLWLSLLLLGFEWVLKRGRAVQRGRRRRRCVAARLAVVRRHGSGCRLQWCQWCNPATPEPRCLSARAGEVSGAFCLALSNDPLCTVRTGATAYAVSSPPAPFKAIIPRGIDRCVCGIELVAPL